MRAMQKSVVCRLSSACVLPILTALLASTQGVLAQATATGGTITTSGVYRIHTFTNVGTTSFVVSGGSQVSGTTLNCDVLVVAGGGSGGSRAGAGGGAGGLVYSNKTLTAGTYSVTVGQGGAAVTDTKSPIVGYVGTNGSNSVFGDIPAAIGGGGGGCYTKAARNGGCGGGGGAWSNTVGIGSQGYNGGLGAQVTYFSSGGGGGMGAAGGSGASGTGGTGGAGLEYSQFASVGGYPAGWFAGGGGGSDNGFGGFGGNGGGGKAATAGGTPNDAVANTGGGGGGVRDGGDAGGYVSGGGGSGIVIVRYIPGPPPPRGTIFSGR